ncbi:TIR domain-containing protein [Paeniglutamicibacter sp.]|uniref:TIR domain-containing protein n=1 Tax=Paeniglutamicibacter sp. TaxID=1934391 RepID=UPI003989BC4F
MALRNSLIVDDMTNFPRKPYVFIGSSAEGLKIARSLQAELEETTNYLVERWDVDTFDPGSFTLESLVQTANKIDFAILVATGEDTVTSRGTEMAAVRDNIIFEFGLFLGALGRERVYYLSVDDAKLPSDLLGLTRLTYRTHPDRSIRAGLNSAVVRAQGIMDKLGPRAEDPIVEKVAKEALAIHPPATPDLMPGALATVHRDQTLKALEEEIKWLCSNATDQGWSVIKRNQTLLRLRSPKGKDFTLARNRPASTRAELRKFVAELRANGLRVNRALQGAVEDSPF